MIRRLLRAPARFLVRQLARLTPVDDPWERIDVSFRLGTLGSGARYDFAWYFEGESTVPIGTLHDLRGWLRGCQYLSDESLFHERDYWQHPRTFEQLKRGDCEDFALWAWRKLVELDYDADLVIGRVVRPTAQGAGHAWVTFQRDGVTHLMEPCNASRAEWIRPLSEVRDAYIPHFGVTARLERYCFAGQLLSLKEGWGETQPQKAAPRTETIPLPFPAPVAE